MSTLHGIVRARIREGSGRIHDLKQAAIVMDGERVVGHINPLHQRWPEYRLLKRDASLWLTALRLFRKHGEAIDDVRLDAPDLVIHAPGRDPAFVAAAHRRLRRLRMRLAREQAHA